MFPPDSAPIPDAYREKMNRLAQQLDQMFNGMDLMAPRKIGFGLLVFPFGDNIAGTNKVNWISNAKRHDMLVALRELLTRWESEDIKVDEPGK